MNAVIVHHARLLMLLSIKQQSVERILTGKQQCSSIALYDPLQLHDRGNA